MNYNEVLKYIHSLGMFSKPAGLERIKLLMEKLGNPQKHIKAIHIAGTNGKGSTAAFTSSVFCAAGYKTGLFISPFIIDFRERIQINGEYISQEDLINLSKIVKETKIEVTEFEFITAVAFLYFAREKCDIAVIETGLGGRFDATNVLENVLVSAITKIGLDHTAILGDTLSKIATEKCGIIKNDITVSAFSQRSDAFKIIEENTKKLIIPDKRKLQNIKVDILGNEFIYDGLKLKTKLGGEYQIENALTAIEIVKNSGLNISNENIQKGLYNASFPARLEIFGKSQEVVLDGAHNKDGASALKNALNTSKTPVTAIVGMMKDKDCEEFLRELLPLFEHVIAVKACDTARALTGAQMAELCRKYCKNVYEAKDYSDALDLAISLSNGNTIYIFGSLYLASNMRPLLLEL